MARGRFCRRADVGRAPGTRRIASADLLGAYCGRNPQAHGGNRHVFHFAIIALMKRAPRAINHHREISRISR